MEDDIATEGHETCGGKTRGGTPCKNKAGYKTDHPGIGRCAFHLGATPTHQRAANLEIARQECVTLGIPILTDPGEALIREVWECAGNIAFYRAQVQQLPTEPEPDAYIPGTVEGEVVTAGHWVRGDPGVYGRTYHVSGLPTGEAKPHVWVVLYNQERDRMRAVCESALKANVEERRVRLAEADATMILGAQVQALVAMGMGDRLDEFRRAFSTALQPAEPLTIGAAGAD